MLDLKASKKNVIDIVKSSGLCAGCGVCEAITNSVAIKMQMDEHGYLRPQIVDKITIEQEHVIEAVCPAVKVDYLATDVEYHPIWGSLLSVDTGFSLDKDVRKQGSSGGVISALAIYLLETKKVDFIVHTAVSNNDPLLNDSHISYTREDVIGAAGSRYAPSAPLKNLEVYLSTGASFAFIGKPCDVVALRQLSRIDPRINKQVKYMFSFMCAGVPSQHGTNAVLSKMGLVKDDVTSFRYRGDGWPGKTRAITKDGSINEMDYNDSWGKILNGYLQLRCKVCADGIGEFADIVCADAWYGKDGYPDFEERDGRSLVLTRTYSGRELLQAATKAGYLQLESLNVSEIEKMQPYQVNRKKMVLGRLLAVRLAIGTSVKVKGLGLVKASLSSNFVHWGKSAVGTYRRVLRKVAS